MKTIIIPDIHNRVYWIEEALSSSLLQPYDKVIFLGDYFDDFRDTSTDIELAAEWLKKSVYKSNRIHLFGTHDLYYRFPYNPYIMASGNTPEKERIINSIIGEKDWKLLKLYYFEQNFLLTHAGLHTYMIGEYVNRNRSLFGNNLFINQIVFSNSREIIDKIVKPATEEAYNYAEEGDFHPWLSAGIYRGGNQTVGGIIWLDWLEEFVPIPGLNQIVGHTEMNKPDQNITENSINFNLDTRSKYIGILQDSELNWIKNPYL